MYNECYKRCLNCGKQNEAQISQVTLGFGEFNLDDLEDLVHRLDERELRLLHSYLQDKYFYCDCGRIYSAINGRNEEKLELAKKLFG